MPKNLISSLVISVVAFVAIVFINGSFAALDLLILLVVFVAVFVGTLRPLDKIQTASRKPARTSSTSPSTANADSETGTVKWFNVKKGYGFITRDAGDDVFVHYRNILGKGRRALAEGQRVSFVVIDGDKGLQADEVDTL